MRHAHLDLTFAGDLVLDEPDPDYWLGGIAPALRSVDVAIGHLEVPHTRHAATGTTDVPAPGADPDHLPAIARAGFAAVSLAGNHIADCGPDGIADTIEGLDRAGVAHSGAGASLAIARMPTLIERSGRRIALLSYNCVGPQGSWATRDRPGCAFVRIDTAANEPIQPTARLERIDPRSLECMIEDIERVREQAQIVIVAFHKGIVHTPAALAPYERPLAHAAIDAGCDIVVGHHAHIVRGIELRRGKPIFHGLGNGCVVTRALSPTSDHPRRAEWARRRREIFGFEPDPSYTLAPFHPEAVNAMLGRVRLNGDGKVRAGFVPVNVEPPGRPVLAQGHTAQRIVDYMKHITVAAGLPPLVTSVEEDVAWVN